MTDEPTANRQDRPIQFIGSAKDDLSAFPPEVKLLTGYALRQIQRGGGHPNAKTMKGHLRAFIEIRAKDSSGRRTYRTICTTEIGNVVTVLHAFLKKAKSGIATPKRELDLIERRFKAARDHYEENHGQTNC
jgi:phage-related protein